MSAIFIQDGNSVDYINTTATSVTAGDVVVQNDLVGIAKLDIATGALGTLALVGVFDVPKTTGATTAIGAGAKVYWDATAKQATVTSTNNKYLGKTTLAAADGDITVRVRMDQ